MNQNSYCHNIRKLPHRKRRGVAEVISTLLLVVITVVGAVILTTFIDESFVSGSLAVTSGTDITSKTLKLRAYDTRDGDELMGYLNLDNTNVATPQMLCRDACAGAPANSSPANGGSDFMVIQIENRGTNSIFMKEVYLDNVGHIFDVSTIGQGLNVGGGAHPVDGTFAILSTDTNNPTMRNQEIAGGQTVNLLIKLDTINDDIELLKDMRVQFNIGASSLAEIDLVESGDTV